MAIPDTTSVYTKRHSVVFVWCRYWPLTPATMAAKTSSAPRRMRLTSLLMAMFISPCETEKFWGMGLCLAGDGRISESEDCYGGVSAQWTDTVSNSYGNKKSTLAARIEGRWRLYHFWQNLKTAQFISSSAPPCFWGRAWVCALGVQVHQEVVAKGLVTHSAQNEKHPCPQDASTLHSPALKAKFSQRLAACVSLWQVWEGAAMNSWAYSYEKGDSREEKNSCGALYSEDVLWLVRVSPITTTRRQSGCATRPVDEVTTTTPGMGASQPHHLGARAQFCERNHLVLSYVVVTPATGIQRFVTQETMATNPCCSQGRPPLFCPGRHISFSLWREECRARGKCHDSDDRTQSVDVSEALTYIISSRGGPGFTVWSPRVWHCTSKTGA